MRNVVFYLRSGLGCFLFFENFNSHLVDGRVIENDDAAVGTRFYMNTTVLAKIVVAAAKIITNGLNCSVELICDLVHRTVGQAVFETTKFVECDCLCHDKYFLELNVLVVSVIRL